MIRPAKLNYFQALYVADIKLWWYIVKNAIDKFEAPWKWLKYK